MNPLPGITLQSIAQAAGVAKSTVSKALRNDPTIPEATCKRIQETAHELGYKPSPAISALMSQLRRNRQRKYYEPIAFVTAFSSANAWRRMIQFNAYFEGASERFDKLGFRLEEFWLGDVDWRGARLSQILRARSIRGVLLAPTPTMSPKIDIAWEHFSVVAFGYGIKDLPCHRVTNDQYRTMLRLLRRLDGLGYRRIGLMYPKSSDQNIINHLYAATAVYQSYIPAEQAVPAIMTEKPTPEECLTWVRKHHVEAIVTNQTQTLDWLKEAGLRVPEDVGVVFFSGGDLRSEQWAGVDQKPRYIGMTAAELMAEQLYENRVGVPEFQKMVLVEGEWCHGKTVQDRGIGPSLDWEKML